MVIGSNCCALDLIRFHVKCLFVNRVINKNVAVCWLCKKCSHCDKMPYYEANKKKSFQSLYNVHCFIEHEIRFDFWCCAIAQRQESSIIMYFECLSHQLIFDMQIFHIRSKYLSGILLSKTLCFSLSYFPQIFLVILKPKL